MKENRGWSDEGVARFNALINEVKESRMKDNGRFDKMYMEKKLEERDGKRRRRRAVATSSVVAFVELDSSEDEGEEVDE